MHYLEHQGPRWIVFFQTEEQRIQTQISQKTLGQQQHCLSPGSAWKGRVSSSYPGVGSAISTGEHPGDALPASPHLRSRRDALQPPQVQQDAAGRDTCGRFPDGGLRCVTWNTGSLVGSVLSSQRNRELKLNYFGRLIENNNVICLQEVHGKNEFLQAIQVWAPRFRLFGTFIPGNENAGGSAICIHRDLLPEEAIVSHVITCQGRDHLVSIRSGRHNLVIVNVHCEPELTLRQLRGRLRLIHWHWPAYSCGMGVIFG